MRDSMRVRLKRWSSSPVRVKKKRLPRFSNVHMLMDGYWLQFLSLSLSLLLLCESYLIARNKMTFSFTLDRGTILLSPVVDEAELYGGKNTFLPF